MQCDDIGFVEDLVEGVNALVGDLVPRTAGLGGEGIICHDWSVQCPGEHTRNSLADVAHANDTEYLAGQQNSVDCLLADSFALNPLAHSKISHFSSDIESETECHLSNGSGINAW